MESASPRSPGAEPRAQPGRLLLACECTLLFLILPVALYYLRHSLRHVLIAALFLLGIVTLVALVRNPRFSTGNLVRLREARGELKWIFLRLAGGASILFIGVLLIEPETLFAFPRTYPGMWCLIMVFYPAVSVYPQELIFRAFFFHRYARLFDTPGRMVIASGVGFGLAHLVFGNWVAVALSTVGGVLFARTYLRTRSLVVTGIEHGLWGDFIFTVGLGVYFYSGAIR